MCYVSDIRCAAPTRSKRLTRVQPVRRRAHALRVVRRPPRIQYEDVTLSVAVASTSVVRQRSRTQCSGRRPMKYGRQAPPTVVRFDATSASCNLRFGRPTIFVFGNTSRANKYLPAGEKAKMSRERHCRGSGRAWRQVRTLFGRLLERDGHFFRLRENDRIKMFALENLKEKKSESDPIANR